MLKFKVVGERTGQPIGFGMSIVRQIAHVVDGSPAGSKWSKLNVGEYILALDGQPLGKDLQYAAVP